MKKTLLVLLGILVSIISYSQNKATELYNSGNSNFNTGKFQEAISNYTDLLKMVDEKTVQKTCFINRGLSYGKLGKYDLAISDFTEAVKLDSTDMASFVDRGMAKMYGGYLEQSKNDFKVVLDNGSNKRMNENSLYWLARINYSQTNFEETIEYCDLFCKKNPNDSEVYFIRGTANDMLRNFKQSIKDYSKAIKLKPNYVKAIANRGTAKINLLTGNGNIQPSLKETRKACVDLKRAKELGDSSVDDLIYVYCEKK